MKKKKKKKKMMMMMMMMMIDDDDESRASHLQTPPKSLFCNILRISPYF